MRVARRNNGITYSSRCRFCFKPYNDEHKVTWGKSLHFCDSPACRVQLYKQVTAQKDKLSRDAPDVNWIENPRTARNNPYRSARNNPALQWTGNFSTVKVGITENGALIGCRTFRREDVWRKDGLFTTGFSHFISEYMDPKYSITYTYNSGDAC